MTEGRVRLSHLDKRLDSLGNRLRYLRKEVHRLTLEQLARQTGISRANLSRIEKGEVSPTVDTLITLANFFDISLDWLVLGAEKDVSVHTVRETNCFYTWMQELEMQDLDEKEIREIQLFIDFLKYRRQKMDPLSSGKEDPEQGEP